MVEASEYPQPQVRSTPYQSPMYNFGSSIVTLTNPEDEIYRLELALRSMVVDAAGNGVQKGKPLMNDLGVCRIVGHVQTIVSRVTIMSNLDEKDLPMLLKHYGNAIIVDLMVNRKTYEILEPVNATRRTIFTECINVAYICARRAFEEGEKRFWKGSQQDITTRVEGQSGKSGWLNKLMGIGK